MTPEEAFEKWWDENWGDFYGKEQIKGVYLAGARHQENQQLLCPLQIREALGDKEGKLSQDELVERVKGLVKHSDDRKDFVLMPKDPSLRMLDVGWGICGTKLSSMEPCQKKIRSAQLAYAALLSLSPDAEDNLGEPGEEGA